ncbi:S41 family peptidase [Aeromonas veronii]|uniref:S41 family peptidase n=1 Tax=Aeromonas veronii TaxID=654 RepID=UPI0011166636|nr:S41 family peptidase [Aeromonas veronii]TNI04757.1 peptidase S41 [Aeromonas veronii]HDO1312800.1 PD40 domain-containing protein [Aeromonas veronii]HDO1355907.1 PD40 domain-containing protein [Aeromonas veronii]
MRSSFCFTYLLLSLLLFWLPAPYAADALWLREPAFSPDGKQLAFTWQGRIFIAHAEGGQASALTGSDYLSQRPIWSPDGKLIAFSANLYGNEDVFVVPASGGKMERLTRDSRSDFPQAFSPDGERLLISSQRLADPDADHFVAEGMSGSALYWTSVNGGKLQAYLPLPIILARPHGQQLAYQMPSMDQPFRKHQRSFAVPRLWLFDGKQHRQLTEDRIAATDPVWSEKGDTLFYLSERSGDFNVWRRDLASGKEQQLTHYKGHPVRGLSASRNGDLVWSWLGELYRLNAGSKEPRKLIITPQVVSEPDEQSQSNNQVDEILVSEEGKELILVSEGSLFAVDPQRQRVRQLTDSPSEQSSPLFAEKGRSLIYLSEQDGHAALYRLRKTDPERLFSDPGLLHESLLLAIPGKGISRPVLSPDSKQLAFVVDGQAIHLLDLISNKYRELVPASFNPLRHMVELAFAPDSRFLALTFRPDLVLQEIAVIDTQAVDAKPVNVSLSGYMDWSPNWSLNGDILYWQSTRYGVLGADGEPLSSNLHGIYSSRAAKADFMAEVAPTKIGYGFETGRLSHREALLLFPSGNLLTSRVVHDQLIYLVEESSPISNESEIKGYSLDLRKGKTRQLFGDQSGPALATINQEATMATLVRDGEITRIPLDSGEAISSNFDLMQNSGKHARMVAAFDQIVRLTRDEFYRDDMNGVDWDAYVATYRHLLPDINNGRDFSDLLAELAGELNVSHTGGYSPARYPNVKDETASLGGYWQDGEDGVVLTRLLPGGPLAQESDIGEGSRLLAINGTPIATLVELDRALNHKAGMRLTLTFQLKGSKKHDEVEVTAIDLLHEYQLQLDSWIAKRRALVAKLSDGRVGYVYLPEMNSAVYEELVSEALGRLRGCDVLILDVRFNKGGYLANTLVGFLTGSGKEQGIAILAPKVGQGASEAASRQWTKPSVVLVNAGSYSEGSAFPEYYRTLKIGPIVGEPVPGTATGIYLHESRLIPGLLYGIPTLGLRKPDDSYYENQELIPDVQVALTPADILAGRDPQLEAAVQNALKQIENTLMNRSNIICYD